MPKVTLASNGAWDLNTSSLPYTSTLLPTVTLDLSGVLFRSSKIPSFPSTGGPIPSPAEPLPPSPQPLRDSQWPSCSSPLPGVPPRPLKSQTHTHTSQSTARIKEMSTGRLTASRMMARVRTPPAGMPAAPTLDAVAVTLGEKSGQGGASAREKPPQEPCSPQPVSILRGGVSWVWGPSHSQPALTRW